MFRSFLTFGFFAILAAYPAAAQSDAPVPSVQTDSTAASPPPRPPHPKKFGPTKVLTVATHQILRPAGNPTKMPQRKTPKIKLATQQRLLESNNDCRSCNLSSPMPTSNSKATKNSCKAKTSPTRGGTPVKATPAPLSNSKWPHSRKRKNS